MKKKSKSIEYWYDPNPEHLGAIRIIDKKNKVILGSDPDLPIWKVSYQIIGRQLLEIDFHSKKTHRIHKILYAKFSNKGNDLNFMIKKDDKEYINTWKKIGNDPTILTEYFSKIEKNKEL